MYNVDKILLVLYPLGTLAMNITISFLSIAYSKKFNRSDAEPVS